MSVAMMGMTMTGMTMVVVAMAVRMVPIGLACVHRSRSMPRSDPVSPHRQPDSPGRNGTVT
jgi:hypothetical protein